MKKIEEIQIGEANLSLFSDDIILFPRDHKSSTKKLFFIIHEMIHNFFSLARHGINLHKSTAFLYHQQTHREGDPRHALITIASKKIIYLGTNSMKEAKDLYNDNFNYLKKEMRKTLENGKTSCMDVYHGLVELILWKLPLYQSSFIDLM